MGRKTKRTAKVRICSCPGGEGGIRTRGGFYPSHAFQACDLNRSSTSPVPAIVPAGLSLNQAFWPFTIIIAELINADTSVMLLGTMRVVVASLATRL